MKKCFYLIALFLLKFQVGNTQDITWSQDIACIIYTHCSPCHNSYNNPEIQFMNYEDVFDKRLAVELFVNTGQMPPSMTNKQHSKFIGDKTLTKDEIELIKIWARDLALLGDSTLSPQPPVFPKPANTLLNPAVSFSSDYVLSDTIEGHLRRCFIVDQPGNMGRLIKAIEVVPAEPYVVHSVYIYSDTSSIPYDLDMADSEAGYSSFFGTGSTSSKPLYGWSLGSLPFLVPKDLRIKLDSNAYFIIQVQYAEEGAGQVDSTIVNISFDTSQTARSAITVTLLSQDKNLVNGPFEIPVDSTILFHEMYNVTDNISLLSIAPNAHYYCDNMKVYALLPNNDTVGLLQIDDWDAGWSEGNYFYQRPIHVPIGSVIHAYALYSNTLLNQHDPDDSLELILAGTDEHGEEMVFNFTYLLYETGDEGIVFDTLQHRIHYLGCQSAHSGLVNVDISKNKFKLFPNPASDAVTIQSPGLNAQYKIAVYNSLGQLCLNKTVDNQAETILDISEFISGIYFIQITSEGHSEAQKLVITK